VPQLAFMKHKRLIINYDFDFKLLGLISSAKSYKLAWSFNQALALELNKDQDLELEFGNNVKIKIGNYIYQTENSTYRLLQNKAVESNHSEAKFLLPDQPHLDYLLQIEGETYPFSMEMIIEKLKSLNTVEYIAVIDIEKLKTKENLLF